MLSSGAFLYTFMNFKTFIERKEEKFDRVQYYFEYVKNLVPKSFKVSKDENNIIIKCPRSSR